MAKRDSVAEGLQCKGEHWKALLYIYVKLGVKECIVGTDGCSSSAFYTVILAFTQRCLALEEEVKKVTHERDASQERAVILEEALHNLNLEDD
ncbi:uncharacterized protein G2W53_027533 [Senna tora]|uniref:Uncharacterized protein n=1 Tax=Senna tora TaxID=362788 RepID=A0A834WII2_9FABA|nr:uncharacterized protein G2W53_027533 [Senna tora]